MKRSLKVGSRESVLAVVQAEIVMASISASDPDITCELVTIKTTGDRILDTSLDEIGGKGLFIKELEQALASGVIDISVHSYKDMPYEEEDELPVVALSQRESPFDVLVLPPGTSEIDASKPVGSSSLRRTIQLNRLFDGLECKPVRGNVITRLAKLDRGEYSALILAEAGLNRLSLQDRVSHVFTVDEMIPSGSQGILAVQGRRGEDHSYLDGFHNKESEIVSKAERHYLKTLAGGCSSPVAVYARLNGNELLLTAMYVDDDGRVEVGSMNGSADEAAWLGESLARQLKARLENT